MQNHESAIQKTVLVTGGAGFIGSHLCEGLLSRGYKVRVLDNLISGRREWLPKQVEFFHGDIADQKSSAKASVGVDGIFHCAAMSRSGPSQANIELCTLANVVGTQNMLLAAREAGVRRFIYSGSSTFYGNQPPPHREDGPSQFLNAYALTKYVGEEYCRLFAQAFGMACVILRYFSVYGPRQPESGSYALVLGIFLRQWAQQQPLEIHGDGEQRRDFVHVRDVVRANIAAYESDVRCDVFNVGSGTNLSVKELADMISPAQFHAPARADDSRATLADISKIHKRLGWKPQTAFGEGLEELMRIQPCP